jgi:hypothetical protein
MKIRLLALSVQMCVPFVIQAMENQDLTAAMEWDCCEEVNDCGNDNEDPMLASMWAESAEGSDELGRGEIEGLSALELFDPELAARRSALDDLNDLPEAPAGVVPQLRKFTLEDQARLNKQYGPEKFAKVAGTIEYKLTGDKGTAQAAKNDSGNAEGAAKE